MNSILSTLRNMFSGEKLKEERGSVSMQGKPENPAPPVASVAEPVAKDEASAMPVKRTVIQAPVLCAESANPEASAEILIKAQPSQAGDQCKFMLNRDLLPGHSWYFPNFESAAGSPLAEALFSVDGVETALVQESTLTVTRQDKSQVDWQALAKGVGAAVRQLLQSGSALIDAKIVRAMPPESEIREKVQYVIDTEVNPGVAGHGGTISLLGVRGNTVTIRMGGGCQGCSAADVTLKIGIHNSFRKAIPAIGAILDETDHKAGLNPYYS